MTKASRVRRRDNIEEGDAGGFEDTEGGEALRVGERGTMVLVARSGNKRHASSTRAFNSPMNKASASDVVSLRA